MKPIFTLFIIYIFILNNVLSSSGELEKDRTIKTFHTFFIFHSKDFDDDETMKFKIECPGLFISDNIEYYYMDEPYNHFASYSNKNSVESSKTYTDNKENQETKYFKIKKIKTEYSPTNGKYLIANYYCDNDGYEVTISNIKDELLDTSIIVIVAVIFVALIIFGIFYLFRKTRQASKNKAIANANINNVNNNKYNNKEFNTINYNNSNNNNINIKNTDLNNTNCNNNKNNTNNYNNHFDNNNYNNNDGQLSNQELNKNQAYVYKNNLFQQ